MNLTQLRYFQAVCKYNSVTHASQHLHISQPSLSNAVQDLEKEFDVTLFKRQYRGMQLTPEGHRLLELADQLLEHADQVHQIMSDLGRKQKCLRLGIPPMIGSLILPGIYRSFLKHHPNIRINITEGGRQTLMRQLDEHSLDMVFLPHDTPFGASYQTLPFSSPETVCCVSSLHPLSKKYSVCAGDLESEPLVLFKNSFFQTERILSRFTEQNITPNILLQTDQLSTVHKLVSSKTAVGFLFRELAESYPDLVPIPLEPVMKMQISLIWESGKYLSHDMKEFIEYIKRISRFYAGKNEEAADQ